MGGVHRYRVCGRDLCCFGFVQALSGGWGPFAFRYRYPHVGLRDVVLDDHVVPVLKLETKNSMALLRGFFYIFLLDNLVNQFLLVFKKID